MTLTGKMAAVKKNSDILFAEWHFFIFLIFDSTEYTYIHTYKNLFIVYIAVIDGERRNIRRQQSSTHYLSDTNRFDVSSKGPSSGISDMQSSLISFKLSNTSAPR